MAMIFAFLLGIGNFALHRAVFESGHIMLAGMSARNFQLARIVSMILELGLLILALHASFAGELGWAGLYLAYSLLNALGAWLMLSKRI